MELQYQILIILFIHWVADFLFQTQKMAMNKSSDNYQLFLHVLVYSSVWFVVGIFFFDFFNVLLFTLATFILHFSTDYVTSRWTGFLYKRGKFYGFPSFFSVIGLDQFLHYLQLILCYEFFLMN